MNAPARELDAASTRYGILRILWAGLALPFFLPILSPTVVAGALVGIVILSLAVRTAPPLLLVISSLVATGTLFLQRVAGLSSPADGAAFWLSHRIAMPIEIAPGLLVSRAIIVYAFHALATRRLRPLHAAVIANVVLPLGGYATIEVLAFLRIVEYGGLGLLFTIYWAVLLVANSVAMLPALDPLDDHRVGTLLGAVAIALACGFLTLDVARLLEWRANALPSSRPKVAVFTPGRQDAHGVTFASSLNIHGLARIGLYGDLPVFVRRLGLDVAELDSLGGLSRQACDVLVCPSMERPLLPCEQKAIATFLAAGGRLIVSAEHTNIESNATTLNALLKEIGLQVSFDTTHNLFSEALRGTLRGSSRLGRAVRSSPCLQHNRGASLRIESWRDEPVLLGRFWLSDLGDSLAAERAYMGDARLSPGDRLGNLVLMAEGRTGRGKVFLTGDSSVFLNQDLAYNAGFLADLFTAWPMEGAEPSRPVAAIASAVVLCLLVCAVRRTRLTREWALIGLTSATGALLLMEYVDSTEARRNERVADRNWAIISTDENNGFDRDPFDARSVTALALEAFRSGYLPEIGSWRSRLIPPRCLFVINPTGRSDSRACHKLASLAAAGTHVVLAGDGDNPRFVDLAREFGFVVSMRPLGALRSDRFTSYSAWGVELLPADADTFVVNGIPVGGTVPHGGGRVTVIADGGFLLSKNLEQEFTFDAGNCAFLRDLLGQVDP